MHTLLDLFGLTFRDIAAAVVGGSVVGILPFVWKALKETKDWLEAIIKKRSKTAITAERDQMKQAYDDLIKKFADTIKNQVLPSKIRIIRDTTGAVVDTQLVTEEYQPVQDAEVSVVPTETQSPAVETEAVSVPEPERVAEPTVVENVVDGQVLPNPPTLVIKRSRLGSPK